MGKLIDDTSSCEQERNEHLSTTKAAQKTKSNSAYFIYSKKKKQKKTLEKSKLFKYNSTKPVMTHL